MSRQPPSLRQRLVLTHVLIGLISIVIVALLTTLLVQRNLTRLRVDASLENATDRLADYYALNGNWDGVEQAFRRQANRLGNGSPAQRPHIQVVDDAGQVVYDNTRSQPGGSLLDAQIRPIVNEGVQVGELRYVPGAVTRAENAAERAFLWRLYVSVVGGSLIAFVIALGLGTLLTRSLTRPLRSMTQAARRLAAGESHTPLVVPAAAELGTLAMAFNTMAEELDRQEQLRRQLVADIAHELRTPLSVLRLQVEAIEDGVEQPTSEAMASLGQEVTLLQRLVDDLRLLSLADAGQISFKPEPIDPRTFVAQAGASYAPRARQQRIALQVEPGEPLPDIRADPQRLAQVLGNLIENALRYTPPGGTVSLRAYSTARSVVLAVSDTGPGIAPDDLAHIFDRFYRADRARSREKGGTGLGLAIVQRLSEAMGARVEVESTPGSGATFRVIVPVG